MTRFLSLLVLAACAIAVPSAVAQQGTCCQPTTGTASRDTCCPVDGKVLAAEARVIQHNGFPVNVCSAACAEEFAQLSDPKKDLIVAESAQPVELGCALTGCPNIAPLAQPITYKGTLFQVCCPGCRSWWSAADENSRDAVFAKVAAARDGKPAPDLESLPGVCCTGDSSQGVVKRELASEFRVGAGFAVCGASISVASVEQGSPASKAGLAVGDLVVSINGEDPSVASLMEVLQAGTPIAFEVKRGDKVEGLTLTPELQDVTSVACDAYSEFNQHAQQDLRR